VKLYSGLDPTHLGNLITTFAKLTDKGWVIPQWLVNLTQFDGDFTEPSTAGYYVGIRL
jgi:hypothetical protein